VGGAFLLYQWDALLLETGFLAIWLAPAPLRPREAARAPVEPLALWLLRLLLFKLMLLSGAVKLLSGDPTWRHLAAMQFHYWTQPIPTWTSWYAFHLPEWVHRAEVVGTFAIELGLPLLIFGPRLLRWAAASGLAALQLLIAATGNYGFFNLLTLSLCGLLFDDAAWRRLLPPRWRPAAPDPEAARRPGWPPARLAFAALAALLFALSSVRMLDSVGLAPPRPRPFDALARVLDPFQLTSSYGLFAVMTTDRDEIEVEGSRDGAAWEPYVFPWKPGPLARRPGFAGLHMPRLDWQMWFASLRGCAGSPWFHAFLLRLLQGEPAVLGLLAHDPFAGAPPRYVRTTLYRYTFTDAGEANWWRRVEIGPFCPTVELHGGRLAVAEP
jgi:hypothetical protein